MANAEPTPTAAPPRAYAPVAALLSYLVPGLGQIVQGRVAKGVLFLVCLYGLFFYGMYLGNWRNVYIPESPAPRGGGDRASRLLDSITDRARFAGQFWIGAAAWPAVLQSWKGTPYVEMPDGSRGKVIARGSGEPRVRAANFHHDLLPVKKLTETEVEVEIDNKPVNLPVRGLPVIGTFMAAPDEDELNDELRNSDKKYELGWMYTVIAGVLNILVIYDAFAGAAFGAASVKSPAGPREPATPTAEAKKEEVAVA
jgi:hypothetical protein